MSSAARPHPHVPFRADNGSRTPRGKKVPVGTSRMELVRARFEILRRDAEIDWLRRRLAALEPPGGFPADATAEHRYDVTLGILDHERAVFERLGAAGGEVPSEILERIRTIAHRPWQDAEGADRALLSDEELRRMTIRVRVRDDDLP